MNEHNKLLVVDGFNLLSRGYFATSYGREEEQLSKNSNGQYTNGLRVFFQKLFQLVRLEPISHMVVAWDVKREESIRRQYAPDYKATRGELPNALIQQYETCTTILDEIGIAQLTISPYEADDIIGCLTQMWKKQFEAPCAIYSNDRDLLQLINESTTQIIATKAGEVHYSLADFEKDYQITPAQWIDVKALLGDKSDNIPGCAGVGEKSALPLIQTYQTVENLYEVLSRNEVDPSYKRYFKKLEAGFESVVLSKKLATIICEIEELQSYIFDEAKLPSEPATVENVLNSYELKITYNPAHSAHV
ncbi:5'-3' exonuclease [Alkalihalobacillus alcalophilus ATCC 27647 = CGMCC 1.3604]|uniref:5'-3' exonuclease n=1 Tax=Alkalihalobacillus alcalophilus ATCC 27647 = CGMCC 1.3604 TaxID=1218173 RepID=A0A094WPJ3_ALKAL|nr:5'-3' exonuclease H3TH domain-containing protein [Alkalihalobacillus alcalophilus]KGA98721.1 5'-3' exonuclease [Alkalihalobacillus alcalophilus ATCC 27647 = CGMCC 1.3604]MED1563300.1 5'-3' exonuclease H3TH domain-containing protein [Alkalihalobacillus alcalophilus]THG89326.1 5'-3' exonuclease [Alkalihalobacillus alcalophilus ATCC 27647 = CGMCC 1.3604]